MESALSPTLSATGIAKTFGTTQALRGVTITLRAGEVHAVVGENGAGKSTLVKILAGALTPDQGTIQIDGVPVRFRDVRDAVRHGIVPIYQHLSLMPHLSVAENLLAFRLADGPCWGGFAPAAAQAIIERVLADVQLPVDPQVPLGTLSLPERQLTEIARGILQDGAVLILDEPTTALNRAEVARLFGVIAMLRARGRAILFISHRLDEVDEIADRVTVLRDGQVTLSDVRRGELSHRAVVEAMIGRPLREAHVTHVSPGPEWLRAEELTSPGVFSRVSLAVRRGEIVGIVGLLGSGALELGAALAGAFPVSGGRILIGDRPIAPGDRAGALMAGIGFIPVDRDREGIFQTMSVLHNGSASILHELAPLAWLRLARERARIVPWLQSLAVRPADPSVNILSLSGGNQQKVLFVRSLASERLTALVALEPARGVDVGAREEIRRALVEAARKGLAVVVVSSDLEEVAAVSHRLIVMRDGEAVAELPTQTDHRVILAHLSGPSS